jgi:hypothetical protein
MVSSTEHSAEIIWHSIVDRSFRRRKRQIVGIGKMIDGENRGQRAQRMLEKMQMEMDCLYGSWQQWQ